MAEAGRIVLTGNRLETVIAAAVVLGLGPAANAQEAAPPAPEDWSLHAHKIA
jgi:hypothetical protein